MPEPNQLARLLRRRGLSRGDHIALLMENHPRFFEVIAAAGPDRPLLHPDQLTSDRSRGCLYRRRQCRPGGRDDCRAPRGCRGRGPFVFRGRARFAIGMENPTAPFERYEEAIVAQVEAPLGDESLGMPMMRNCQGPPVGRRGFFRLYPRSGRVRATMPSGSVEDG